MKVLNLPFLAFYRQRNIYYFEHFELIGQVDEHIFKIRSKITGETKEIYFTGSFGGTYTVVDETGNVCTIGAVYHDNVYVHKFKCHYFVITNSDIKYYIKVLRTYEGYYIVDVKND